jgi:uncharacterized caspase-like protein
LKGGNMTYKALFFGINKHNDMAIPELTGAVRDATALHALFLDSISNIDAELCVDADASYNKLSTGILETLSNADNEDVIIIFFAGHGTNAGTLICYDTNTSDLLNSSISMNKLATTFKSTKARVALLILDCCYSGQAPARAFETNVVARALVDFQEIAGEGKIILAACEQNEYAYEQPGTGHGLLTQAIIDVLTTDDGESCDITGKINEIINQTRISAEKMGCIQTPKFLGTVSGAMSTT